MNEIYYVIVGVICYFVGSIINEIKWIRRAKGYIKDLSTVRNILDE